MNGRTGKVVSISKAYVTVDLGTPPHWVVKLGPAKVMRCREEQTTQDVRAARPAPPQPPLKEMKEDKRPENPTWPPQPRLEIEAAPPSMNWLRDPANITKELLEKIMADEGGLEDFLKQMKSAPRNS